MAFCVTALTQVFYSDCCAAKVMFGRLGDLRRMSTERRQRNGRCTMLRDLFCVSGEPISIRQPAAPLRAARLATPTADSVDLLDCSAPEAVGVKRFMTWRDDVEVNTRNAARRCREEFKIIKAKSLNEIM